MSRSPQGRDRVTARAATKVLLAHYKGSAATMARALGGLTRQTVFEWLQRGYVSTPAALVIDEMRIPGASKEQLRPDVPDWDYERAMTLPNAQRLTDAYDDQ